MHLPGCDSAFRRSRSPLISVNDDGLRFRCKQLTEIVHVCSSAPEVIRLLNAAMADTDTSTSILVSITLDMVKKQQIKRLGMDLASNYHELDEIAAKGIDSLTGLQLLRHINLICLSHRATRLRTAAYAPQLNLEMVRAIEDAGTQTIIEDIELVRATDQYIMVCTISRRCN